ncbi:MAG: hypothetical protein ACXVZQ_04140 [Terriglobales bacterium]
MKTLVLITLALALATAMLARQTSSQSSSDQGQSSANAQSSSQTPDQSSQSQNNSDHSRKGKKQKQMSGKVSDNGKTFTNSQENKSYIVNNPDALQNYDNQQVSVILAVDPDTNTIHIIQVVPAETQGPK